ncbi:hypothetical protein BST63_00665 [Bradyrhizobium canariense]|uniref:Uncharacterized protein n=1 Tax=Bradyrhizobium canariense TaxID=255045 RepID=A0ABX3XBI1_9BRAD|nr:hypothetical protein BSR47_03500 [Bradyrhizobium canariense]OSJ36491.1 hypothetical protein BST63_00665 [Bradyrhizobium canariense]
MVVVVRGADSACIPAWWCAATEADRQDAWFTSSKAARSRMCQAYWGHTAGAALCFFDQTSKIFQF